MDFEKAKRRQSLKVILSEIIMFLTVVVTVVILAFIVSGYWINENFEVERQGMLQISSHPSGADVVIDDETSWLQKTNTSKVLSTGEHTIVLSKEGYDSWSKTINITEGLLYRLNYPRLFPLQRNPEPVYDTTGVTAAFVSKDRKKLLLYYGDLATLDTASFDDDSSNKQLDYSTILVDWKIINLDSSEPTPESVKFRDAYDFFRELEPEQNGSIDDFKLSKLPATTDKLVFIKFYEDHYLALVSDSTVSVYERGDTKPILEATLGFIPTDSHAGQDGEFIVFSTGSQIATLDMETLVISEWTVAGDTFDWLDDNMIYTVADGALIVYDFDGLNRRDIATDVDGNFPVTITNDRWLYYFSQGELIRESLK